jgi:hypothetical protein
MFYLYSFLVTATNVVFNLLCEILVSWQLFTVKIELSSQQFAELHGLGEYW